MKVPLVSLASARRFPPDFSPKHARQSHKLTTTFALAAVLFGAKGTISGMKDFGNRLEGTTLESHGGEDLTLLGIERTFEKFPRNTNLTVRFYLPRRTTIASGNTSAARRVSVEASEKEDFEHYFMQSTQSNWTDGEWNAFGPWPTKDVIDPLNLDPSNIAVRAEYREGNDLPTYLPVDVFQKRLSAAKAYTIYFRTSWDLHSLEKSVINPWGQLTRLATEECNLFPRCAKYPAGSSQHTDVDISSLPEGVYVIKMTGHVPGRSQTVNLSIRMYHRPV